MGVTGQHQTLRNPVQVMTDHHVVFRSATTQPLLVNTNIVSILSWYYLQRKAWVEPHLLSPEAEGTSSLGSPSVGPMFRVFSAVSLSAAYYGFQVWALIQMFKPFEDQMAELEQGDLQIFRKITGVRKRTHLSILLTACHYVVYGTAAGAAATQRHPQTHPHTGEAEQHCKA